jgi:hypothetical protein
MRLGGTDAVPLDTANIESGSQLPAPHSPDDAGTP